MTFKEFLEFPLFEISGYVMTPLKLILPVLIFIIARFFISTLIRLMNRFFQSREVDGGKSYAIIQVVKYILYTIAVLVALQAIGINFSLLIGGTAALLVGIGLGMQKTFMDWFSGIILLTEGAVEVGDTILINGDVATVKAIGIRSSKVETRDQTIIIITNAKLAEENVVNWSNNHKPTRFHINVGVAYGSDVRLVEKVLIQAASEHQSVLKRPPVQVQLIKFGESSLDFRVLFFSNEFFRTEFMKSDIRFRIVELFNENDIVIPFPQRDVWVKKE